VQKSDVDPVAIMIALVSIAVSIVGIAIVLETHSDTDSSVLRR